MPYKAYWASDLTGGGTGALDKIDGAALADKDIALVILSTGDVYEYWLDEDSAASESSPDIIAPDANGGDKRWLLKSINNQDVSSDANVTFGSVTVGNTGLHILDSNASHDLIIKPGSDLEADRELTITTGDAARALTLNENFTIGDGTNITITGVTQANTLTLYESLTLGDGYSGTLTFSASGDTLTVGETLTLDGASGKTLTLEESLTVADGTDITITGVTAARSITLNENLTIGDGTDITITGVTAARTLTLNENLTVGDGYNGTLTYSADAKTLTVEDTAVVSQDYSADSTSVSLAGLALTGNLVLAANSITGTSVDISNAELQLLSAITSAGGSMIAAADAAAQLALLSGNAGGAFSWNSQNLTALGTLATAAGTLTIDETASLSAKANLAGPTFSGTVTVPSTNFTIGSTTFSETQLSEVTTFFGSTDISAAEAETLTDTSDADALHTHDSKQSIDATLTAFASLLTAANKIPYATGADTGSELDLAVTVGNPGSDTTLVSEQGIREAISAFATTLAGLTDTTITGPADLDLLQYDNGSSKWVDRTFAEAGVAANTFTAINALIAAANAAIDVNSQALTSVGTIDCGTITVVNGSSISLQEDITFTGATTVNQIKFPNNLAVALAFQQATNLYQSFVTTSGSEAVVFHKDVGIGTATPGNILDVQDSSPSAIAGLSIANTDWGTGETTQQIQVNWKLQKGEVGLRNAGRIRVGKDDDWDDAAAADSHMSFWTTLSDTLTERMRIDSAGNIDIVSHDDATIGLKLGGTLVTASAAQLNEAGTFFASTDISAAEAETLTDGSDADALHAHDTYALESVLGTAISTGLVLDGTDLKASAILQKYHGVDPAANVLSLLGAANYAAMLALLTGQAGAAFSWNSQNLTSVGTIACGAITTTGGTYTSPTLVTPALGTPGSGVLTSCTGLPAASVVAGSLVANMLASDHGTAATDMLVNVSYGTGAAPTANTTTIGSLYIKHVA